MRYSNYIFILLAILMTACNTEDTLIDVNGNKSNQIQIVGRNIPFEGFDVASRTADSDIKMVDLVIFYATTNTDGTLASRECVYYQHSENTIIPLERAKLVEKIGKDKAQNCYMFMIGNYPGIYQRIRQDAGNTDVQEFMQGKGFDYFLAISSEVEATVDVPDGGLPRFGVYGKTADTPQGQPVNFNDEIPGGTTYEIPMECLFAKMVFNISVDPDQTIPDVNTENTPNSFKLTGYKVHNLVKTIDLKGGTENTTDDIVEVYTDAIVGSMEGVKTEDLHNVSFSFYLPERFFKPVKSATEFVYPFGKGTIKTKENSSGTIREEDADLRQRFKPLLAKGHTEYNTAYNETSDKKATYVTFTGVFTNHQGHSYDVSYDIYVGSDNFGNFDVVRNRQYNNNITIRGIQNASDQSTIEGAVSIDHRVNITRTKPIITNMRLETILDAHFEVRPLRIRKHTGHVLGEGQTAPNNVTVEIRNADGTKTNIPDWIRLERSYGVDNKTTIDPNNYCTQGSAAGKRKYFTYGLVSGKQLDDTTEPSNISANTSVTVPITETGECVWIYVDECTEASYNINAMRSAMIRVTYDGGEPIDYIVNQHKLFAVKTTRKEWSNNSDFNETEIYFIEHEEEYLHNFDSDDTFMDNKTQYEGMQWGLNGIQLSHTYNAAVLEQESGSILTWLIDNLGWIVGFNNVEDMANTALSQLPDNPKYDFYLKRDNGVTSRDFKGINFNQEIAAYLVAKYSSNTNAKIEQITLSEKPMSAFAYCYNRNKRNSSGIVVSQNWYMPATDEIEDIMEFAHLYFDDFHGKLYWSCQPSFEWRKMNVELRALGSSQGYLKADYYIDDITRARATRALYLPGSNTFDSVLSSGVPGYAGTQNGRGELGWKKITIDFTKNGGYESNGNLDFSNHPGNLPRTDKARVRCIRNTATIEGSN